VPFSLEREIKLTFESPVAARQAIGRIGATPRGLRRLQQDFLLDTADGRMRNLSSILRLRIEPDTAAVTFKGPVQAAGMKLREEIETPVADGAAMLAILGHAGFAVWFRYEKYRQEFSAPGIVVAIDETPVGTFVELEGDATAIDRVASELGRGPEEYLLDSYRGLYLKHCAARGIAATDMIFETR
jgi:adenylate cyclase class 2